MQERIWQEKYRQRCDREWEAVFQAVGAGREQVEVLGAAQRQFVEHGHRQLMGMDGEQLTRLGLSTYYGVARVNRALRSGQGLDAAPSGDLDWAGYHSNREAAASWRAMFAELGERLRLEPAVVAYRGVRVPRSSSLAQFVQAGSAGLVYTDAGFAFATLQEQDAAEFYAVDSANGGPHWSHAGSQDQPIVLKLGIREGICVPPDAWRSPELAVHLARARRRGVSDAEVVPEFGRRVHREVMEHRTAIENAAGQVVIDAGSRWRLVRAQTPSTPGALWQVELEQVTQI